MAVISPATGEDASILLRMKEDNDGAEPAPSSICCAQPCCGSPRSAIRKRLRDRAENYFRVCSGAEPSPERDAADAASRSTSA